MNLVISGIFTRLFKEQIVKLCSPSQIIDISASLSHLKDVCSDLGIEDAVKALCSLATIDYAFIKSDVSFDSFKLLAIDMDSTLITIECIDELAGYAGKMREVSQITAAAMRGEVASFESSLRRRVSYLAGLDSIILEKVYREKLCLTRGARELIETAHRHNIKTLLISGGFTYFSKRLVRDLGLSAGHANELEVVDGKLTGRLVGPIIGPQEKATIIRCEMQRLGIQRSEAIVIGDGSNDIPMMRLVDASVAFHAKPQVNSAARYAVRYGSLATIVDFFAR